MPHKITNTGNATFDDGVTTSTSTLQSAVAAATTQAAADTAARAHFNRCIALAETGGINATVYREGLKNVGTHA